MNEQDATHIQYIIRYCGEIKKAVQHFGNSQRVFMQNRVYQNACAMPILQIGEAAKKISEETLNKYNHVPWRAIMRNRDRLAHHYVRFESDIAWDTIKNEIPVLEKECCKILKENNISFNLSQEKRKDNGLER